MEELRICVSDSEISNKLEELENEISELEEEKGNLQLKLVDSEEIVGKLDESELFSIFIFMLSEYQTLFLNTN